MPFVPPSKTAAKYEQTNPPEIAVGYYHVPGKGYVIEARLKPAGSQLGQPWRLLPTVFISGRDVDHYCLPLARDEESVTQSKALAETYVQSAVERMTKLGWNVGRVYERQWW